MPPFELLTVTQLLYLLKDEEKASEAFSDLYTRYHQDVYRYAIQLLKVPELAEDCVHEVMMKLWQLRHQLVITQNFKGYLLRTTHNHAIDILRMTARHSKLRKELAFYYEDAFCEELTRIPSEEIDPILIKALESLSPKRRRIFELCKRQGKSYAQVAAELSISQNTVKEHMVRALSCLRKFIGRKAELTLLITSLIIFF